MFFFFFSSRRRHTRFDCDWSSDVCSSDLCDHRELHRYRGGPAVQRDVRRVPTDHLDRKSTRLNSSHSQISYAVFCLKKKKYNITRYLELKPCITMCDLTDSLVHFSRRAHS